MNFIFLSSDLDLEVDALIYFLTKDTGYQCYRVSSEEVMNSSYSCNWGIDLNHESIELKSEFLAVNNLKGSRVFCRDIGFLRNCDDPQLRFAQEESWSFFEALMKSIPKANWHDFYYDQLHWDNKIVQYRLAKSLGVSFPKTLVTNVYETAAKFVNSHVSVIKQMSDIAFNDSTESNQPTALYTSRIEASDIDEASIKTCPVLLQEHIHKTADIRYYYVDGKHFAARIDSQSHEDSIVDFRKKPDATTEPFEPPQKLHDWVEHISKKTGLRYSAFDFAECANGEFVFFEFNPIGNWLWIEQMTDLPITKAIADSLISL